MKDAIETEVSGAKGRKGQQKKAKQFNTLYKSRVVERQHAGLDSNDSYTLRGKRYDHGEFDPGSERTLAARLKHASRTAREMLAFLLEWRTGE